MRTFKLRTIAVTAHDPVTDQIAFDSEERWDMSADETMVSALSGRVEGYGASLQAVAALLASEYTLKGTERKYSQKTRRAYAKANAAFHASTTARHEAYMRAAYPEFYASKADDGFDG